MYDEKKSSLAVLVPTKSPALALLFSVILGPVGMLYATVIGSVVMGILEVIVFKGTPHIAKQPGTLVMLWLLGCVWAMLATERYNRRLINRLMGQSLLPRWFLGKINRANKNNP